MLEEYREEVKRLEKDVDNVMDIMNALPNGCFKRQLLEQWLQSTTVQSAANKTDFEDIVLVRTRRLTFKWNTT